MGFDDALTGQIGQEACALCEKPTSSHAILLDYDEDEKRFVTVNTEDDAVTANARDRAMTVRTVCHSCYEEYDGDAEAVAEAYTKRIEDMAQKIGKTIDDFVDEATGKV